MNSTELRIFSIGLLILVLSGAASASTTTISIADATVEPGDVIILPIMIGAVTDYGTGTIEIEYDPSVAYMTQVTDGPMSQIAACHINNTTGLVRISASNSYGTSGDIIFANVTFEATGVGSTPLNLNVILLGDTAYNEIAVTISNGSLGIEDTQPPEPFFIYGCVCYENGTPCNSHSVNLTNLNTSGLWHSETSGGSNYYHSLISGTDLNATDVLRFDAVDDGTCTNVSYHTVTQDEVDAGGFEYNITLESPPSDTVVSIGSAEACVGDSVNVSINITGASSIGYMDIRVAYNASILNATNVMDGWMIGGLSVPLVEYHLGYVDINNSLVTYHESIDGDGELSIITFDVVGGNTGDNSPLDLEAEAYMEDQSPVALETEDGVVTVTGSAPDPAPALVTYTISNTVISPNGDGIMDDTEIDVEFSEPVNATIRIEDATGVVKTLYAGSEITDPDPQIWDGTDYSGNIVADGTYQVNITMDDGVNPVVCDDTKSITVMAGIIASVSIADVSETGMINVPITIENVTDVGSCQLTLNYDPDVVIVSSIHHSDFDSLFVNLKDAASGSVSILVYQTSNPGLDGNVIVADVTFTPVGIRGSSTPLDLEVLTLTDATPDCNPIPYTVRDGSFLMFLNGDVNGDNRVDVADCMFLAKHLIGLNGFETIVEDAADVNGNDVIEVSDCMYLAKHLAGMDGFEVLK